MLNTGTTIRSLTHSPINPSTDLLEALNSVTVQAWNYKRLRIVESNQRQFRQLAFITIQRYPGIFRQKQLLQDIERLQLLRSGIR